MSKSLLNEDLYLDNIVSYVGCIINYQPEPDSVGIYTQIEDGDVVYTTYLNDEHGNISICKEFNDFYQALISARHWYEALISHFKLIDAYDEAVTR